MITQSITVKFFKFLVALLAVSGPSLVFGGVDSDITGDISFAENTIQDSIPPYFSSGVGLMVPLLYGQGFLFERRLADRSWAWAHFTYQETATFENTLTPTGTIEFKERHRFEASIGADRYFSMFGSQRWVAVLGTGFGLRRSEVQSTTMESVCRPRCNVYFASSQVFDAATEVAVIGLLRFGARVRDLYVFGERTEVGVIFERNLETGVQLLSTNQAPSNELANGQRSKGSLLLELSLRF